MQGISYHRCPALAKRGLLERKKHASRRNFSPSGGVGNVPTPEKSWREYVKVMAERSPLMAKRCCFSRTLSLPARKESRSIPAGLLGQCTQGQCPLIQLSRPRAYSTFDPGLSQQHTRLGKRSCLMALRFTATAASHQSQPKFSTGLLARGLTQS
jgi:hypothetical protein